MSEDNTNTTFGGTESYKSPTEMFKGRVVALLFECIGNNSHSNDQVESYAFCRKSWDLSVLLERFTPLTKRKEIHDWLKQLKDEIAKIREDTKLTPSEKKERIQGLEYHYANEVHLHNQRILINSPLIEVDAEGDLDVTDEDLLHIVRNEKRTDDGRIEFKQ